MEPLCTAVQLNRTCQLWGFSRKFSDCLGCLECDPVPIIQGTLKSFSKRRTCTWCETIPQGVWLELKSVLSLILPVGWFCHKWHLTSQSHPSLIHLPHFPLIAVFTCSLRWLTWTLPLFCSLFHLGLHLSHYEGPAVASVPWHTSNQAS